MISFKNEKQIKEYLVDLENHVTMLKAHLICEKRKCTVVEKTTDGFIHKEKAMEHLECIKDGANMIMGYLKN